MKTTEQLTYYLAGICVGIAYMAALMFVVERCG